MAHQQPTPKLTPAQFRLRVPTPDAYLSAFQAVGLRDHERRMLTVHFDAPDHLLTATFMASAMHYANYNAANLHYGRLAGRLCRELNLSLEYKVNAILCFSEEAGRDIGWTLWPQVVEALTRLPNLRQS